MSRFKGVMAKISSIDNDFALTALKNGFWHESKFCLEMTMSCPLTIEDALQRASNFAKVEEEISLLAKKHTAYRKPQAGQANIWTRPGNERNSPRKGNSQNSTLMEKSRIHLMDSHSS